MEAPLNPCRRVLIAISPLIFVKEDISVYKYINEIGPLIQDIVGLLDIILYSRINCYISPT